MVLGTVDAFGSAVVKTQSGKLFSFCQAQFLPFLQTHFVLNFEQSDSQTTFLVKAKEGESSPLQLQFVEKNGSGGQNSGDGMKDVVEVGGAVLDVVV